MEEIAVPVAAALDHKHCMSLGVLDDTRASFHVPAVSEEAPYDQRLICTLRV